MTGRHFITVPPLPTLAFYFFNFYLFIGHSNHLSTITMTCGIGPVIHQLDERPGQLLIKRYHGFFGGGVIQPVPLHNPHGIVFGPL